MDRIRLASRIDACDILEIYAPFITNTVISFEYEIPNVEEFASRIDDVCKTYPYLVYISDDKIIGYAYASQHSGRTAYDWSVNVSVYISPDFHSCGIAFKLYNALFKILKEQGFFSAYAGYTSSNIKSERFHKKFGFTDVGTYHNVGYKFGAWHDVTWLEKVIGDFEIKPQKIITINELSPQIIDKYLQINIK
ncbi:MAG: N-acetyltransferase family protein [Eubacteriales bacterium]